MIHINTKDRVKLRLSGVNITNTTGPAIFFEDSDKGYITISEGSQNRITCGAEYDVDAKAAIFSNDDLEIKGQGSLSVTSQGHHGIASDDELKIEEGVIQITSERDGIHVNDGIYITGGDIEITADEDGVQSDGILSITGGSVNITTQGEVTADTDTFPGSMEPGQRPQRGQEQAAAPTTEPTATPEDAQPADDVSSKGIKAETGVYVGGGVISVSSTDHSLHSAGDILISDGALTLSSSVKKGISGHGHVTVNGGSIIIPSATEGIESKAYLTVNGGEIRITCTDDGVNAGGSETEQTAEAQPGQPSSGQGGHDMEFPQGSLGDMTQPSGEEAGQQPGSGAMEGMDPPRDAPEDGAQPPEGEIGRHPGGMGFGGEPGGGSMMYSADKQIIINGGYLVIDAQGDGIDSNGDLTINGGMVLVNGPTSGGDSALDTNGTIYQNGGTVIAVGSAGMMEGSGEGSAQASVTARFNQTIEAGTRLYINDSQGNTLAAFVPSKNYASVIFSSPQVEEGETYTIYQGGSVSGNQTDGYYTDAVCTGGQALVSVAAAFDSGAAGMGRGGFDGGQRGQRGERPSFEGEQEQQQT